MNKKSEKSVKILLLTTEFPPNLIGGLGRHVADLALSLAKEEMDVTVITVHNGSAISNNVRDGVKIISLPIRKEEYLSFHDWLRNVNYRFIRYFVTCREEFDIIHAHDWLISASACALKELYNKPLVVTIHATEEGRSMYNDDNKHQETVELEKRLIDAADKIIVCSEAMRHEVMNQYPNIRSKLNLIPNGVLVDQLEAVMPMHVLVDSPYLFTMGRIVKEKGFHVLLESYQQVLQSYHDLKLVIAGEGPYRSQLVKIAEKMSIADHIVFCGLINEAKRNWLLKSAECNIFPSLYEPFGIVLLESMYSQTITIASNVGGMREIIDYQKDGFLVKPANAKELSNAIEQALMCNSLLPRMGTQAQNKVLEKFLWVDLVKKIIKLYYNLMSQKDNRTLT